MCLRRVLCKDEPTKQIDVSAAVCELVVDMSAEELA